MLHTTRLRRAAVLLLSLGCGASPALARPDGCWLPGESLPGIDGDIMESMAWDPDGAGPQRELIVFVGLFTTAGTHVAPWIVAWDGVDWVTFGDGLPGHSHGGLAIYQNELVAAANEYQSAKDRAFVVRWNGQEWEQIGGDFDESIGCLAVYDGELIAGGWFTEVEGKQARGLAKWTGSEWVEFGGGVAPQSGGGSLTPIEALHVHDGSLFVGGVFAFAGGVQARNIARWEGAHWHALGSGVDGQVYDLATHDGAVAVGGSFNTAGGVAAQSVALWNGATWSSPGGGLLGGAVLAVGSYQGELYVGGVQFNSQAGLREIAKWNGSAWVSPGGGFNDRVRTLTSAHGHLYVGGMFTTVGDDIGCNGVGRWDGTQWSALDTGINDDVYCVEQFQGDIIIGGRFIQAGDAPARSVARQVDGRWQPMGDGLAGTVFDLQVFHGEIIACGYFLNNNPTEPRNIARWDGGTWQSLGGGFNQWSILRAMTIYQGDLIACGHYILGSDEPSSAHVARWDGEQWSPVGAGANKFPGEPLALAVYHGRLIAAGGGSRPIVAEWTGQHWRELEVLAVANNFHEVLALAVYQGDLIAAGDFIRPNNDGRDIARWDGHQWHSMGSGAGAGLGLGGSVWSLAVAGGNLIAGGVFLDMDNVPVNSIARWDGEQWSAMAGGLRGGYPLVRQLNRIGNSLYAVGGFTIADERVSARLARWQIGGSCAADIAPANADGEINIDDLLAVVSMWGACPTAPEECRGNIITMGQSAAAVDVEDLLAVIGAWGPCS